MEPSGRHGWPATCNLLAATVRPRWDDCFRSTHTLTPTLKLLGWARFEVTLWITQNVCVTLYFLRRDASEHSLLRPCSLRSRSWRPPSGDWLGFSELLIWSHGGMACNQELRVLPVAQALQLCPAKDCTELGSAGRPAPSLGTGLAHGALGMPGTAKS